MNNKLRIIAMFFSIVASVIASTIFTPDSYYIVDIVLPLKKLFVDLFSMVIGLAIFFNVLTGIISIASIHQSKKYLMYTLLYFTATTCAATIIGIAVSLLLGQNITTIMTVNPLNTGNISYHAISFFDMISTIIPKNLITPFKENNIIQIVFLAFFLGLSVVQVGHRFIIKNIIALCDIINKCVDNVFFFLPIGIFALLTSVLVKNNTLALVENMISIVALYYFCCIIHTLLVYMPIIYFSTKYNVLLFFKQASEAAMVAFTTASSIITIPISQKSANSIGIDRRISGLVIPIGATINMDGTAIFLGMICVIISCVFSVELNFLNYLQIIIYVLVLSIGTPGIPGATFVIMMTILSTSGLPIEGIALFSGIDIIIEMAGTAVNVLGDIVCSAAIDSKFLQHD